MGFRSTSAHPRGSESDRLLVCVNKTKSGAGGGAPARHMLLLASVVVDRAHENHRCIDQKHDFVQEFDSCMAVAAPSVGFRSTAAHQETPRVTASSCVPPKQNQARPATHLQRRMPLRTSVVSSRVFLEILRLLVSLIVCHGSTNTLSLIHI